MERSLPRSQAGIGVAERRNPGWQDAQVVDIIDEAPDAVTLRLQLSETTGFLPGQYYNVRLAVPDRPRPVQRAYSVGSAPVPDPSIIDLGVREIPDGLVSPSLVRGLTTGDVVEVRGPYGRFTRTGSEAGSALLVGAGSGLVPLMSMIRDAATRDRCDPMWLVCSAITYEHAFYREELAHLMMRHGWLRVVHCVTRDPAEPRASYHRRIDRNILAEVLAGKRPDYAYLCGPPAMVESTAADLGELGMTPESILTEKYD